MAEPWLSGFLVDERWQFSADDKQSILAAFNPPAGADIEPILACLLDITQVYRSYQANDDRRPSKAVAARQLAAIAEHAAALVRALDSMG